MKSKRSVAAAILGRSKTAAKAKAARANGKLGGRPKWIRVEEKMPRQNQRVIAKYVGVYGPTVVTYWFDGTNHHFGNPPVSQPATHWMPVKK